MPHDRATPRVFTRRDLLVGSGAIAAGMTLYSGLVARHEISTLSHAIAINNLPEAFRGFRVVQLSDFHLDEFTEPLFLEEVVRRANALRPDLVLLTGDYITRGVLSSFLERHAASRCAEILSALECPLRFAVLGNHDVAVDAPLVTAALHAHGLPTLHNRFETLTRGGDHLHIGGTADPVTDIPNLWTAVPDAPLGPVLLMVHAPDYIDVLRRHPRGQHVDLVLSGHTHGGQIRVPVVGPIVVPTLGRKYIEGHFRFGSLQLYVNRGLGAVGLPFRLNCPPEISLFTLERSADPTSLPV